MSEKMIMLLLACKNPCSTPDFFEKHKKFKDFNGIKEACKTRKLNLNRH